MRILVTGGAGFVGANLIRILLSHKHMIRVLDNFSTGQREYLRGLDLELIDGDILDYPCAEKAVAGVEAVIHLAAQTGVPGSLQDPFKDCRMNVLGTLNLLECSRRASVARFVLASSNAPVGRQAPPATEDKAPLPISPYGASKLAAESYCLAYHGSWGLKTIVLRFANLYGPYSSHKGSVVAKFIKDMAAGKRIIIDGDGKQTRDFIYVGDLCQAVALALQSDFGGEVFQIATGIETTVASLASRIQELASGPVRLVHGPARQGDIRRNYSDISKVKRMLGWEPEVSLEIGLQRTYVWFRESEARKQKLSSIR